MRTARPDPTSSSLPTTASYRTTTDAEPPARGGKTVPPSPTRSTAGGPSVAARNSSRSIQPSSDPHVAGTARRRASIGQRTSADPGKEAAPAAHASVSSHPLTPNQRPDAGLPSHLHPDPLVFFAALADSMRRLTPPPDPAGTALGHLPASQHPDPLAFLAEIGSQGQPSRPGVLATQQARKRTRSEDGDADSFRAPKRNRFAEIARTSSALSSPTPSVDSTARNPELSVLANRIRSFQTVELTGQPRAFRDLHAELSEALPELLRQAGRTLPHTRGSCCRN